MAMNGGQQDALVAKLAHQAGAFIYSPLHPREYRKPAAAELKHLGLEFHSAVTAVAIERAQYLASATHLCVANC